MNNQFNIGDILINKKKHRYNVELHYVIVGSDDTYTYVKRLDSPYDDHKPVRYPTHNMDWFFNVVSRGSEE